MHLSLFPEACAMCGMQVTNAIAQEILSYTHSHPQWHAPKKVGRRHA